MELYAKSKKNEPGVPGPPTIFDHCCQVHDVADSLWELIEADLAKALGRDEKELRSSLLPLFPVAALLHDIAKANSAFQAIIGVLQANRKRQPVRHEVLAGILINDERFWGQWFARALDERQKWMVVWAVAGHHLEMRCKRSDDSEDPLYRTGNVPKEVLLYLGHSQVSSLLDRVRRALAAPGRGIPDLPLCSEVTFDTLDDGPNGLESHVRRFVAESSHAWRKFSRDPDFRQNLALLKALLIAADAAGSAVSSLGKSVSHWTRGALSRRLQPEDLRRVVDDSLKGRAPRDFQRAVASATKAVTVVIAGCGNGKTTAAYMWGEKSAAGRKLFFAYPTTGTASAGFKDYLFAQTDMERHLLHSRAEVDLQMMADSPDASSFERAQRLESVRAWGQQVIACTVDSVLGLLQNQRRPLFAFPAIACGAFVFDEIHSYDRRLFAELLRFLRMFTGVPVLLMSASIPPNRLAALREAAEDRMAGSLIRGDETLEKLNRYQIEEHEIEHCWDAVQALLSKPRRSGAPKVLWVCNTVEDAKDVFRQAKERLPGVEILLYHSRYRYGNRVDLQNNVIDEFSYTDKDKTVRKHQRPALAITTQVCEMSLDISADLLITARCPLPSLVQRLGRLNRYATKNEPKPAYVHPFAGRPYHEEDYPAQMQSASDMIAELKGEPCSQATLAKYIADMQSSEDWSRPLHSAWLDGGWQSEPLPVRDGDNSITVVRQEDLRRLGSRPEPTDIARCTIPMLFRHGFTWTDSVRGYPVAPAGTISYDETKGASWAN